MNYKIPPGVFDIIPHDEREPWRNSYLWNYVENEIRKIAKEYGFQEIRTPMFEKTELFQSSAGETSDIVSKEMYTFDDKGGRSLSLRPEGTAPAIRAFLENNLVNQGTVHKLFYIGPMFRYERSQAGRYRQHHQFGVEAIGNSAPEQDVEIIDLLSTIYKRLGLKQLKVYINSLGDNESRHLFRDKLQNYFRQYFNRLSEDSKKRLEVNPLRILDSKAPEDQEIIAGAPSILESLSPASQAHFQKVQELLKLIGISFEINPRLVRGLDYYNNTVFEFVAGELGSQNSISGGGRYDGLIKRLGGPDLPAIGFGCGLERVIQTMLKQCVSLPQPNHPTLFLIPLGEEAKEQCFALMHELRQENVRVQMDFTGKKLNKVMQYANHIRAQYVAVVGEKELESKEVELKEMATGDTFKVSIKSLDRIMNIEQDKQHFVEIWNQLTTPFQDEGEKDFFIKKISDSINRTSHITHDLETAIIQMRELINSKDKS